jgi:hypothetical protein
LKGSDDVFFVELVDEKEQLALHALDVLHSDYNSNTNLDLLIIILLSILSAGNTPLGRPAGEEAAVYCRI